MRQTIKWHSKHILGKRDRTLQIKLRGGSSFRMAETVKAKKYKDIQELKQIIDLS